MCISLNTYDLSLHLRNGFGSDFYLPGISSSLPVFYSKGMLTSGCKRWVVKLSRPGDLLPTGSKSKRIELSSPLTVLVISDFTSVALPFQTRS